MIDVDAIVAYSQSPEGQRRARAMIARAGGPIYTADDNRPDSIFQKWPDGKTRRGRFSGGEFIPDQGDSCGETDHRDF